MPENTQQDKKFKFTSEKRLMRVNNRGDQLGFETFPAGKTYRYSGHRFLGKLIIVDRKMYLELSYH